MVQGMVDKVGPAESGEARAELAFAKRAAASHKLAAGDERRSEHFARLAVSSTARALSAVRPAHDRYMSALWKGLNAGSYRKWAAEFRERYS